MSIELTPQQQQALDTKEESPPRVIDPRLIPPIFLFQRWTMNPSGNFCKKSVVNRLFTR